MMLDYALMRSILEELAEFYPKSHPGINCLKCAGNTTEDTLIKSLYYLRDNALITMQVSQALGGYTHIGKFTITNSGIDFLQPDGGLSALAAPVIRIAPDSLTAIIDAALVARNVSEKDRGAIHRIMTTAGQESVKTIVQRLINAGLSQAPNILTLFKD